MIPMSASTGRDHVDWIADKWLEERPELDIAPLVTHGRVRRVSALFERMLGEAVAPYGINIGEFEVLAAIRRSGEPFELNPSDLRHALIVSGGTITNRIARLTRKGLVGRRRQPSDGRGLLVGLTPEGVRVFDAAFEAYVETLDVLVAPIVDRQDQLGTLLRELLLPFRDWDGFAPRDAAPITRSAPHQAA
jgi:DNA-binding MarR family transcriptional regulator